MPVLLELVNRLTYDLVSFQFYTSRGEFYVEVMETTPETRNYIRGEQDIIVLEVFK